MDNNSTDYSSSSPSNNGSDCIDFELELPTWSLEQLKKAAIQQRLVRPRSLAWAILLNALPPPNSDIITSIKTHRNFYNDLKLKLSMDPRAVIGDDPLSQNDESVWKQHFCDKELKTLILQDVVRTFPDELYFRDKDVQDTMVRVLFFWARSHSNVGYRQGMHEVLAPLLLELYLDRQFAPNDISDKLKIILDEDYLEHDSFMLLSAVMKGLEKFYVTGDVVPSPTGRMPSSMIIHNPNEVIKYLEKVKEEYLIPTDYELASYLDECNISMELFGIRWLRLLFGREFPRSELPHLWGFLFADGPMLPNLHYVIIAMLVSIRNTLLSGGCGGALCALMRPLSLSLSVSYVSALALYLRAPHDHPLPPPPPPPPPQPDQHEHDTTSQQSPSRAEETAWSIEHRGAEDRSGGGGSGGVGVAGESVVEGVAEGADVARELAALALLRAHLPAAAAALARALPRPAPHVQRPLHTILHLAALLQCRNHALVDVETALEAAEGQSVEKVGQKQLVPVATMIPRQPSFRTPSKPPKIKEVPLKVFHQMECDSASDFPCLDPLRLRTE